MVEKVVMAHKYTLDNILLMRNIVRTQVCHKLYKFHCPVDDFKLEHEQEIIHGHKIDNYYTTTNRDGVRLDMLIETTLQTYINAGITQEEMVKDWNESYINPNNPSRY